MRTKRCSRCGKQDLELYSILVPNKAIGDTSACDVILPHTEVLERICCRCLKVELEGEESQMQQNTVSSLWG